VKRTVEDKAVQKTTDTESKAIDDALSGKAATDSASTGAAGYAASPTGTATDSAPDAASENLKPGEGVWANYDFKPGDRILYATDFSEDEVGDFPRSMEFKAGQLETVELHGARWLRASQASRFFLVLPEKLPERFTLEFDYSIPSVDPLYHPPQFSGGNVLIYLVPETQSGGEDGTPHLTFAGTGEAAVRNTPAGIAGVGALSDKRGDVVRRARVMGDGQYIKVYLDNTRVLNVPNADIGRSTKIQFFTAGTPEKPSMFGNFRVAAGGKKLYDALSEKGRVATQGIYFDTGSDRIRPESTPTLKEIGTMLKDHPELRLTIEGHTDNVGSTESNQTLSDKRSAAVKRYLTDTYQVDPTRLQAKGYGASKPLVTNDSPEGRQQNRRVELVKM
jgi:OmpA-OmpF porin, OOP family